MKSLIACLLASLCASVSFGAPKVETVDKALQTMRSLHEIAILTSMSLSMEPGTVRDGIEQSQFQRRAESQARVSRILDPISDITILSLVARLSDAVAGGRAEDNRYDDVFYDAFTQSITRIADQKRPDAADELQFLKPLVGRDGASSLLLNEQIERQKQP